MHVNWSNVLDTFGRTGLPARIVPSRSEPGSPRRAREDGDRKRVGLVATVEVDHGREIFSLSPARRARPIVLDASLRRRHLLLLLRRGAVKRRILFGHDERHLFWSILPSAGEAAYGIDSAFEALKPKEVRDAESRAVTSSRTQLQSRGDPIRQGEWFFVPEPEFVPQHWMLLRSRILGRLGRAGRRGHFHIADEMVRFMDESGTAHSYVRGAIHHPEHATIHLDVWHQLYLNLEEGKPRSFDGGGLPVVD